MPLWLDTGGSRSRRVADNHRGHAAPARRSVVPKLAVKFSLPETMTRKPAKTVERAFGATSRCSLVRSARRPAALHAYAAAQHRVVDGCSRHPPQRGDSIMGGSMYAFGSGCSLTSSQDTLTTAWPAATAYTYFSVRMALSDTTTTSAGASPPPPSAACMMRQRSHSHLASA